MKGFQRIGMGILLTVIAGSASWAGPSSDTVRVCGKVDSIASPATTNLFGFTLLVTDDAGRQSFPNFSVARDNPNVLGILAVVSAAHVANKNLTVVYAVGHPAEITVQIQREECKRP